MASKTTVLEVMIHHLAADATVAAALQKRLYHQGIRAGISNLSATMQSSKTQIARHSIYLIGSDSDVLNLSNAPDNRDDSIFISPNALFYSAKDPSYAKLVDQIICSRETSPINTRYLRHMTQASYNAIASQFTDVWFDTIPGEAIETFMEHLPRGATILDAGCGPGHHTRFFKQAGFNPVGLDFSRSMLNIAISKNDGIPFHYGDILSYDFPKAYFDGVWSAVALNHIPSEELPLALANLTATLKFGGFIGLNFQVGRPSEIVSRENDHRFFEYPANEYDIIYPLEALGVRVVATHIGTTTRNIHGLPLILRFATVVAQKSKIDAS